MKHSSTQNSKFFEYEDSSSVAEEKFEASEFFAIPSHPADSGFYASADESRGV